MSARSFTILSPQIGTYECEERSAGSARKEASAAITSERKLQSIIRRIPPDVFHQLSDEQILDLAEAMLPQAADHKVDFRASTGLFGTPLYIRILVGEERRTRERLLSENQIGFLKFASIVALGGWITTTTIVTFAVIVLYLVKSGLGINLMEKESFLHGFFFD